MSERDETPALGTRGEPASWHRARENVGVELAKPAWGDALWSYLFGDDTSYAGPQPAPGAVAAANRRMRSGEMPEPVLGPVVHAPVWTWEVPLYFWVGGVASGASFAALAADLSGDEWSAALARKVALGVVMPAPALLIADLGRPARFLNMLRIVKPRSPMNMGAWCLVAFTGAGAGAVGADLLGARRCARGLGAVQALLGSYLGSYTGVLLATTAVPLWGRSRAFLGPIFVATATATGAAATRLALAAAGQAEDDPTHVGLARLEALAILAELTLSTVNERRLGRLGEAFHHGAPRRLLRTAKGLVVAGLVLPVVARVPLLARGRGRRTARNTASVLYLAGGLAFRFAWVEAGKASASDDEAVALTARASATAGEPRGASATAGEAGRGGTERRAVSEDRAPLADSLPAKAARAWSATVGLVSLTVERIIASRRQGARR